MLIVTTLLGTLAAALLLVVTTETFTSANHRVAQQVFYAADAAVERTIADLRALSDWTSVPGSAPAITPFGFLPPAASVPLRAGIPLDVAALTTERQSDSNSAYPTSPNRPVWRVFGHAPPEVLFAADIVALPLYVVVWVADDVDDGDGNPLRDSNGVVMVHTAAFGPMSARRRIEAVLARRETIVDPSGAARPGSGTPSVRVLSWHEVR